MRLALIAATCRLPGADTPEAFWRVLSEGTNQTTKVPLDRFDAASLCDSVSTSNDGYLHWGTFIENPWTFDAKRFRFRNEEADWTDPQQRLLLTCTHEAFETAGIDPIGHRTGVFVGASYVGYAERVRDELLAGHRTPDTAIVGALGNMLAARISQTFDLHGPSATIDSACSSTLVALHMAHRSIEGGDCDLAVVGGAHLILSPTGHLSMGRAGALSPRGSCRPFGEDADGTVLGEGIGVFLVAPADLAASKGWPVLAHIVATAVDSDGRSLKPMAPRPGGQIEVMRRAWFEAGRDPKAATLIEAHGAGTPVGDRVEAASLAEVFPAADRPRLLGSVKGNVGHLMSAAGVPSLLKVLLAMEHRVVPPTLFGDRLRPTLGLDAAGFCVPNQLTPWDGAATLCASINSFGFGGTNAHVILESIPERQSHPVVKPLTTGHLHRIDAEPVGTHRIRTPPPNETATSTIEGVVAEAEWFEKIEWCDADTSTTSPTTEPSWTLVADPASIGNMSPDGAQGVLFELPDFDDPLKAVRCVHEIAQAAYPRPLRVLTHGAFATIGDLPPSPAAAAAATYVAALSPEWGEAPISVVDLACDAGREAVTGAPLAGISVCRNGRFLRRSLVSTFAPPYREPAHGVWLLIGGATGITFEIAKALAAPGRVLILVGRTPIASAPERRARLDTLRRAGARADYLTGDVRSPGRLLDATSALGVLVGVIHGAGVVRPKPFTDRTEEDLDASIGGKLGGALALAEALRERRLDPVVLLLSSLSASTPQILGGYLADYAAANAGLDALASAMRAEGRQWASVAYSVWAEVGMGAQAGIVESLFQSGLRGLDSAPAARCALRVAAGDSALALVVDRTFPERGQTEPLPDPSEDIAAFVRTAIARAIDADPDGIGDEASLSDLGLDSLLAVDLAVSFTEAGFSGIPESVFFELRTVAQVIELLRSRQGPHGSMPAQPACPTPLVKVDDRLDTEPGRVAHAFALQARLDPSVSPFSYWRMKLRGRTVDPGRLELALNHLTQHHAALHRRFVWQGDRLRVENVDPSRVPLYRYEVTSEAALARIDRALSNAPFDPEEPPLLRAALITQGDATHLAVTAHHAVVDGWSLHRLIMRLWQLYEHPDTTLPGEPAVTEPAVPDAAASRRYAASVQRAWPELPGQTGASPFGPRDTVIRRLPESLTADLRHVAAIRDASLFAVATAAVARGVASWAGLDELVLQIATARRGPAIPPDAIGCFADTVPVLLPDSCSIADVRQAWGKATEAGLPGLSDLASVLGPAPDGGPRVSSPFGLSIGDFSGELPEGFELCDLVARTASHATRLGFTVWTAGSGLGIALNYPSAWIVSSAVERLIDRVSAELEMAAELHYFIDQIVTQCERTPERAAIVSVEGDISYRELSEVSRRFAAGLAHRGIGVGDIVGVLGDAGSHATMAILGIARAGAAWLPLDPGQGKDRLRAMLEDANPALVVRIGDVETDVDTESFDHLLREAPAPEVRHNADELAYVIFTSGSQGRPKGVPIRKASITHYLRWSIRMMQLAEDDHLLQTAPIIFDASIRQMFAPLMVGASSHPTGQRELRDPVVLYERLRRERISLLNVSPFLAAQLAEAIVRSGKPAPALRLITIGGEALPASLARKWFNFGGETLRIINLYGPTETTINATWHEVTRTDDPVPIGHGLPGYTLWVLDPDGKNVDEGELCVGGIGVFDGYLGDIETPMISIPGGHHVYRTGDRVSRRADGALYFLGRLDTQVQIRGVRVEPGEIEAALVECEGIRLAVVEAEGEAPDRYLNAWVEADGTGWNEEQVREQLAAHLAPVMIPRHIYRSDRIPTTATGKLDRGRLSSIAPTRRVPSGGLPRTRTEQRVAGSWARVLDVNGIGITDDFFSLGGDSLAAVNVCVELQAPSAALLYAHPRLVDFATALEVETNRGRRVASGSYTHPQASLLPAQIGFLRAEALDPGTAVTWSTRVLLRGNLDNDAFLRAWNELHARHPMLRAAFIGHDVVLLDETPPPVAGDSDEWPPVLDPKKGWLVRGRLSIGSGAPVLDIIGHHLVGDRWSIAILLRELVLIHDANRAGRSPQLPSLTIRPQDIAAHLASQPVSDSDASFWCDTLTAPYACPFADFEGGPVIRTQRGIASADATQVVGAVYAALRDLTGQNDQIIAVARSGRDLPLPGIADVVAPLATALPVRINAPGDRDPLLAASTAMRTALAHALEPGQILRAVGNSVALALPVFVSDLRVPNVTSEGYPDLELDVTATSLDLPAGTGIFITAAPTAGGVRLDITARTGIFRAGKLERFADAVVKALSRRHPRRAALITYLPPRPRLHRLLGVDPATLIGNRPRWIGEARSTSGTCRVLALPYFAGELDVDLEDLREAVAIARADGAQCVGLAGLLPARTDYGYALAAKLPSNDSVVLTTGHPMTVAAVAMTTLTALEAVGSNWQEAHVALLGVGAIGRATLQLLCERAGAPASLALCDLAERRHVTKAFANSLPVSASLLNAGTSMPAALYEHDLIIGATSQADVVDVSRLRPGTILVDDSFPHCFDTNVAHERMTGNGDVLLLGGGLLALPELKLEADSTLARWAAAIDVIMPRVGLPGCAVGALIDEPALGLVNPEAAHDAWAAAAAAGASVPPLHLDAKEISAELIARVAECRRIGD